MFFNWYVKTLSQATRRLAKGIFLTGLLLIGFGALILALPEIFAALVATIFVIAGIGCLVTAGKIFRQNRQMKMRSSDESDAYRENVQIHIEEHYGA